MNYKKYGQLFEVSDVDIEKLSKIISDKKLLLLSGPSGVGKSTVTKFLIDKNPGFAKIKRFTTKQKPKNKSMDTYYYIEDKVFSSMLSNKEFFEVGQFGPGLYGTTYNTLEDMYCSNIDLAILEADLETSSFIKEVCQKSNSQVFSVFLTPIQMNKLELDSKVIDEAISVLGDRIVRRSRGERQKDVHGRLKGARKMFLSMNAADYVVVNKDGLLEETLDQIYKFL